MKDTPSLSSLYFATQKDNCVSFLNAYLANRDTLVILTYPTILNGRCPTTAEVLAQLHVITSK